MTVSQFRFPDGATVTDRLMALRERANKPFTCGLHPGVENILGLRVPDVRALAKEIAHGNWQGYLAKPGDFYMEERMLHGMVLGQIKIDNAEAYLEMVDRFVTKINSWSVCDTFTFAGGRKFVDKHRNLVLDRLTHFIHSPHEYEARFGVVMLMQYFITPDNAEWFMTLMESVTHPGYYVRMAVAWAVSVAFVKSPDTVYARLAASPLDDWTFNKSLSKITESYRVTPDNKIRIRAMRRPKHK